MKALAEQINELDGIEIYGRVVGVRGLMVEVAGPLHAVTGVWPKFWRARKPNANVIAADFRSVAP
jgi:hypothetical protein